MSEERYHGNGLYDMPDFDRLADARHAWLGYEPEIRDWVYWRVRAWWKSEPRRPAVTAFTSGIERAVATLIEEATADLAAEVKRLGDQLDKTADGAFLFECDRLYCPKCGGEVECRDSFTAYCWGCPNPDDGNDIPLPLSYGCCTSKPMPDPNWH